LLRDRGGIRHTLRRQHDEQAVALGIPRSDSDGSSECLCACISDQVDRISATPMWREKLAEFIDNGVRQRRQLTAGSNQGIGG
jgi:hypothetical protein